MMVGETDKETRKEIEDNIKKDVGQITRTLIRQANERGIWETFGQKEFRDLSDKYGRYICDRDVDTQPIFKFREWTMMYTTGQKI